MTEPSRAAEAEPAYDDSRRLTGPNLFFFDCGAVLETRPDVVVDAAFEAAWRARIAQARASLGWPGGLAVVRHHQGGAHLALTAPIDRLLTATSVNEWACQRALGRAWLPEVEGAPPIAADADALAYLNRQAEAERRPALVALSGTAQAHDLPLLIDDDAVSIGSGAGAQTWPLATLPTAADIAWDRLHAIPTALVTGSNGKTTTVRFVAAVARVAGLRAGISSTEGVSVDGDLLDRGDYSGPAGARRILRDERVDVAVLETARGGILRRGLALAEADAAIVTNLSADHYGEYGIDDLQGLADAKLVVARAIGPRGLLVLNADDAMLVERATGLACPIGWFSVDDAHPRLAATRGRGGATCGVRDGRMRLAWSARGIDADLGEVAAMPLTLGGHARYNVANLLGGALVAAALGLAPAATAAVCARFGAANADNPGRLQRWTIGGARVIVDYAHNPDGLSGLLAAATAEPHGRLALVLGQAGNRADAEIRALAAAAAAYRPALVVLKDIAGMERGRAPGEVAAVLREALLRRGLAVDAIAFESLEAHAARRAVAWARPGDVVVLPIHGPAARAEVAAWLDREAAAR
ncbi:MAG: Mur ligase [Proteobacteria bacterium]|nr:Mur ligase [Pseudomonadota bacterium]